MANEKPKFKIEERVILEKFEGDPEPENLVERIHLVNGKIVKEEKIENGEVVETREVT
jgi:hypothetical protein